jgi:hypothetical protein
MCLFPGNFASRRLLKIVGGLHTAVDLGNESQFVANKGWRSGLASKIS